MKLPDLMRLARAAGAYAFAGVAGLAAAWAVREHIQQRTLELEAQSRVPTLARLVAAQDLPAGATLEAARLAVRQVPQDWAASDSLGPDALEGVEGGVLALALKAGEPVLRHQVLLQAPEAPVAGRLEAGRRALSLPLGEIRDLPPQVQRDDRIDLYVSFSHGGRLMTLPLLQAGKVMSVHDGADGGIPSITLDAAASDALKVIAARQAGVLTGVLRAPAEPSAAAAAVPSGAQDLPALLGLRRASAPRAPEISIVYGDRVDAHTADLLFAEQRDGDNGETR